MRESTFKIIELSIDELSEIISAAVAREMSKQHITPEASELKTLMTREEVKNYLKVSYPTLFHWNNDGILKVHLKRGRKVFYLKSDVLGLDEFNCSSNLA